MRLKVVAAVVTVLGLCIAAGVWWLSAPTVPLDAPAAQAAPVAVKPVRAPEPPPTSDFAAAPMADPEPLERATGDMYLPAPSPPPVVVNPPPIRAGAGAGAGARSMRHARPGGVPKPDDIGCNPPYRWDTTVRPDGIPVKRMKEWCQ